MLGDDDNIATRLAQALDTIAGARKQTRAMSMPSEDVVDVPAPNFAGCVMASSQS